MSGKDPKDREKGTPTIDDVEAAILEGDSSKFDIKPDGTIVIDNPYKNCPDCDEIQDAEDLLSTGLLFEVNRRVLHPFGLALAIEVDDDSLRPVRISRRLVRTDDPEGMYFDQEALADGFRKYLAFMKDRGFRQLAERYQALGWRAQVEPDVDPGADEGDWSPPAAKLALDARDVIHKAREVVATFEEYGEVRGAEIPQLKEALDRYDGTEGQGDPN